MILQFGISVFVLWRFNHNTFPNVTPCKFMKRYIISNIVHMRVEGMYKRNKFSNMFLMMQLLKGEVANVAVYRNTNWNISQTQQENHIPAAANFVPCLSKIMFKTEGPMFTFLRPWGVRSYAKNIGAIWNESTCYSCATVGLQWI